VKVEFSINEEQEKALRKYQEILQKRQPDEGGEKVTLSDTAQVIFGHGVPRVQATTRYALRKAGKLAPYVKPAKKEKKPKAKKAKKIDPLA
jgi:hypothetical protein